jgi:hypothetical protein
VSKRIGFSVCIECPNMIQVGGAMRIDGQYLKVTSIRKVEYVSNRVIQVSGNGTKFESIESNESARAEGGI